MKILYLSPIGIKRVHGVDGNEQKYDMDSISNTIVQGIKRKIPDAEVTMIIEIVDRSGGFEVETLDRFDLFLCDLTTMNANVAYNAGQVERFNKPIIYFVSNYVKYPVAFSNKMILKYSEASIENEFQEKLVELISLAKANPLRLMENAKKVSFEPKVFISYSHQNKPYLDRLMVHLKPLMKKGILDVWVDTKIKTGDKWKNDIENALSQSSIAILLISADFMASDFIVDNELPPLLSNAEVKGTKVLPVIVSPCRFYREPTLCRFQSANTPDKPLSSLTDDEREKIYDQLAHDIEKSIIMSNK